MSWPSTNWENGLMCQNNLDFIFSLIEKHTENREKNSKMISFYYDSGDHTTRKAIDIVIALLCVYSLNTLIQNSQLIRLPMNQDIPHNTIDMIYGLMKKNNKDRKKDSHLMEVFYNSFDKKIQNSIDIIMVYLAGYPLISILSHSSDPKIEDCLCSS